MILTPESVATELAAKGLDGWLLYDFRGQNSIATRALGLEGRGLSRRWFYFLPATGQPVLIVHAIEKGSFPDLPGQSVVYASRQSLEGALAEALRGCRRVAMEYAPLGTIPTLSRVDAGTVEMVRSCGVEVVSSGDLVQHFLCRLSSEQVDSHIRAVRAIDEAKDAAFAWVAGRLRKGEPPLETDVQSFLLEQFREKSVRTDHPPIVAVGPHSGDPHYAPRLERPTRVERDSLLLIDLWAKEDHPRAVWGDITWVAWTGTRVPESVQRVWDAVSSARDVGLEAVVQAHAEERRIEGWQVDRAVRDLLTGRGFGERFLHRTGHNIDAARVHGDGANLDDFETHDTRELVRGLCFSIEPGVYLREFGVRSEIDVVLTKDGPRVFSPVQRDVVRLAI